MKMKKLLFLTMCAVLLLVIPVQAGATSSEPQLEQIVTLHGNGLTKQELKQDISRLAKEAGLSEQQVSQQILDELKSKQSSDIGVFSSGGGGGSYQLDTSRKGTFFYQPAATFGVPHGHIGIYYSTTQIVEAANSTLGIRKASVSGRKVEGGSRIQTVNSTSTTQDSNAANWANGKVGGSYNNNFVSNRSCGGSSFNCSQLVWCAFKQVVGIDIDKDGGWGVYPKDIRDSSLVNTIKTY
ncbi:hypothetical protein [Paenibacillus arenosi]|uniref:Uncharacterized protein n=1 Tax=Paenibacillus arenosi TaxID=2774142 RepID=A0ABR9AZX3_9BACL|nr:hypothetical protein [Paenibacillus arenosi]MBD8499635.1 hypothetical protein [Paenibacillus arenosi]